MREVLEMPDLGVRVEIRDSSDELIEFDVVGRARGFIAAEHVHTHATERYEVIEGTMRLVVPGRERPLGPAGTTHEFLRRVASLRMPRGYPRPLDAAAIVRDFGHDGHASKPPIRVQRALSRAVLALASREYVFVDEWDVAAPPA